MSKSADVPSGLAAYVAVTASYWAFMLSDGALRMLVLLHFHGLGFSPVQLAYLFLLYEVAGVVTNLSAGWLALRFGLTATLYAGLALQILALAGLTALDPAWSVPASVAFVMGIQGASGVAKDLTKMSSKSAVKVLAPTEDGGLFRWVALLTGSKNAVKGAGFFLGAGLLAWLGFETALYVMAGSLLCILMVVVLFMPAGLPTGRKGTPLGAVVSKNSDINRLSVARMFLFGARDTWFVVGIPIYFATVLSDGTEDGARTAFFLVGGFMALWIIGYGAIQAFSPRILKASALTTDDLTTLARSWVARLSVVPFVLSAIVGISTGPSTPLTATLICGLLVFGGVFALNSALHSYLILAFTDAERVTLDVGFYYMSNAAGRLLGTFLSGYSYQVGGLAACLATAGIMAIFSWLAMTRLVADRSA